jgi:uncharacterized protein
MKILEKQDLYDILYGCTILGTGGGGSLQRGLELIDKALALGKQFKLVDFSEVPDEAWIAVPYFCGSVSPSTPELEAKYAGLPEAGEPGPLLAYQALEEFIGEPFYGVMSTELGGGNTAQALYAGAMMDRYILDADPAGRSVPDLQHSTFYLFDVPIDPLACANQFGEIVIVKKVTNDERAEALVRALAVASKNSIGVADHPAQAKTLKNAVIQGAISYARKIGTAYREAVEAGQPAGERIAREGGGFNLFKGEVDQFQYETAEGFTVGEIGMRGSGEYAGQAYRIMFKNEHMISWRDGQVDVTIPDLICVFDDEKNEPVINPHLWVGQKVSVIGLPAPKEWRTPRGLEVFGPKYLGYEFEYVPLEERKA